MKLDKVEKKLREAEFFLEKMIAQERRAFGDREPFDFYLSAFLSATRTVDYRLRHVQAAYADWRKAWDTKLSQSDNALIKFMVNDRNVEVHESGSGRTQKTEGIDVGNTYSDASGTLHVFGPPDAQRSTIQKPAYSFHMERAERKARDVCDEYLRLLKRMLASFKADHS